MKSVTLLIMIITILGKIFGFLRELVFGYFMGTGSIKDIYVIVNSIPSVLFGFLASAIYTTFVPMYNKINTKVGEEEAENYTSNISNIMLVIATIVVVFVFIFTEPIVKIFASGFEGEELELAVNFTRIAIFTIYATAFSAPFRGYLNNKGDFISTAIDPIIQNTVLIIFVILAVMRGNWGLLAIGYLLSYFLMYLPYLPSLKKNGYKHRKILDFSDPFIRETIRLGIPILITIGIADFASIVDKTIATSLFPDGGVSSLDYADKLVQLVRGVVVRSFVIATYPEFSRLAQEDKKEELGVKIKSSLISTYSIVIPSVVGLFVLAEPLVSLIFQRGAFDARSTLITTGALKWYSISLIGHVLYMLLTRYYYAKGDTKTPIKLVVLQVIFDIPLNYILSSFIGLNGLALSTSIGIIVRGFYGYYSFKKDIREGFDKKFLIDILKISLASLIMGLVAYSSYRLLSFRSFYLSIFVSIVLAMITFVLIVSKMKIDEIDELIDSITNRLKKTFKK